MVATDLKKNHISTAKSDPLHYKSSIPANVTSLGNPGFYNQPPIAVLTVFLRPLQSRARHEEVITLISIIATKEYFISFFIL